MDSLQEIERDLARTAAAALKEELLERAAIIEYCGNLDRATAEALAAQQIAQQRSR